MPRDRYEPIKLTQTTRYAGYQFHARVHVSGMQSFEAFKYLILSVLEWVRKRIPAEDASVPELALPSPENYAEADTDLFRPYHFSVGYALDITPLMYEGIWALRLKEPDSRDKEDVVAGRFFTTRIGLWLSDKGYTEMGIRIDVTDPASVEKEVDFAFRPAFVRSLAVQPSVCFEQISELRRGVPEKVETEEDYKRFLYMLDNEDNQLPLVVFTHFRPGWKEEKKEEKKASPGMSMEDFVKNDPMKAYLQFSGVQMPGMGMRPSGFDVDKAGFKMPEMPYSTSSRC